MSGTVTISVEIELGWGFHDITEEKQVLAKTFSDGRQVETQAIISLLEICDTHNVPVSFNIVGHLLLDSCNGSHNGPHKEGWFNADPGTDVDTNPLFYAPDLAEMIADASVDHELCTHTFSHINCREMKTETVHWELSKVSEVHQSNGYDQPVSLVPPRHRVPQDDVYSKSNIDVVRVPLGSPYGKSSRVSTVIDTLFPIPPVANVNETEAILETYSTSYTSLTARSLPLGQGAPHTVFKAIPRQARIFLHQRYLRQAVQQANAENSVAHFNTHLHDLANNTQLSLVADFFRWLTDYREETSVRVVPMRNLTK